MTVYVVCIVGLVMMGVERIQPGRSFDRVRGFKRRAFVASAFQAAIAFVGASTWDHAFSTHRPFALDRLGVVGGALIGYVAITFVYYVWHRARHEVPFLWRHVHQLHHSPARITVLTSFYKHPLEIVLNGVLSSAILYLLVGLSPEAAALAVLLTGLAELFYHFNVRTPRWLGYVIQRPEMHQVHHARGRHTNNYGDLPIWDMLFGTFENPERFEGACGFVEENEQRGRDMLAGKDLHDEASS